MIICAIDPGLAGGVAVLDNGRLITSFDMPVAGEGAQREVSAPTLTQLLRELKVTHAVIEKAQSMPKQGVAGVFRYGAAYGCCLGVFGALGIPVERVSAATWKRGAGLSSSKENSRARAISMFPEHEQLFRRKMDHNRAEAVLLAHWYWETQK